MKKWLIYIFCFFYSATALPANTDTTRIVSWNLSETFDTNRISIDTLLFGFQLYNPLFSYGFSNSSTGNNGLPSIPNSYNNPNNPIFINPFRAYMFHPEEIVYYNTKCPYTDVFYTLGSKKDQTLKILHTQNVNKKFNFGFRYNLASAEGYFKRQKVRDHAVNLFSSYTGNRYSFFSNLTWNRFKTLTNGGLEEDTLFEKTTEPTQTLAINLNDASTDIDNRAVYFTQKINLLKSEVPIDSGKINKNDKKFFSSLIHNFKYEQFSKTYKDVKTDFYINWFKDTTKTKDSVYYKTLENTLLYKINDFFSESFPVGFKVGGTYQINKYGYADFDTLFSNSCLFAGLFSESGKKFNFEVSAKYYFEGFRKDDISAKCELKKYFNSRSDSCWLGLSGTYDKTKPDWYEHRYYSNNFNWENGFKNTEESKFKINFYNHKFKLTIELSYANISNYIYFDTLAFPKQEKHEFSVYTASLNKNFRFGKFYVNNYILYQFSGSSVIRIPDLILYHSLFFRFKPFAGKLPVHVGFDVFYNSYYHGYAYMPATSVFYLQNEKKFGGHPYVDFFVSVQRKKARIFLKAEHLSALISKRNYYSVLHYPVNDFSFKFGISWRFCD
ncbi:MAG: hypothetical protein HY958_06610 [Bacteroidia bacterium]|nr:hypothetical protein [Bacteroidia bacterium]